MSKSITFHDFRALTTLFTPFLISSFILSCNLPTALGFSSSNFHRVDPLRHFKYYDGGYDLRNNHYWASTAFTGIHGYTVAGTILLCGFAYGIFMITKKLIDRSNDSSLVTATNYSELSYYLMFFLILLFTIFAMIATGFAIAENQKTLHRTQNLKGTVIGAGEVARRTIHRVNKVMNNIQELLCPYNQVTCTLLNTTSHHLVLESYTIKKFIQKNGHSIDQAISTSYATNLVILAVNLLLLVAGLVLLSLHWHPGFFMIIIFFWILAMACWVLTGIDYSVHTFAEDTCTALEDFMINPLNSSLNSLLPCKDALKSQATVVKLGQTVHDFVTQLNVNINIMPKELGLSDVGYGNLLGDRKICDPFGGPPNYQFLAGKCPKHAIPIGDLPDILARFTCDYEMSSKSCSGKFLPKTTYVMASAYIRSVQNLIDIYPDLESLIHCSIVKDRISDVVLHQCKPFKVAIRNLWVCILCISVSMVVLLLLWVVKLYQDQGRSFSNCSIIPRHEEP